ncbi:hypothetical protein C0V82_05605 [Niveispirillum cyanobacteriorum]|uniref:Uncharacterized protein n=2 Tax=Niveispirillum cyanobacteriorum TaxID=1612173 RepID=A0A2K9NC60_9PROT|nr:hypothetical protein C0V82_05605 [Niveispirillum cyanobacteriorum]GGE61086.1 hypothetical protein GCM10011317_18520 [Niveispirillum cyanobacteriorum]
MVRIMIVTNGNRGLFCLALLGLALFCPPAEAQNANPPAQAKKPDSPPMEQEVIVTGRRNGEPDFQEQQEFHYEEYRRLKAIYDPDPLPVIRSDRLVRMPEAISSTVQGKPTLTEKQW